MFGWIDFDYGSHTNFEDIENLRLPALYWATYLGPSYVRRIGQSKIINAPAWKVIPLIDGGYLYMTSPTPGLADIHVDTEEVKKYFGIEYVR